MVDKLQAPPLNSPPPHPRGAKFTSDSQSSSKQFNHLRRRVEKSSDRSQRLLLTSMCQSQLLLLGKKKLPLHPKNLFELHTVVESQPILCNAADSDGSFKTCACTPVRAGCLTHNATPAIPQFGTHRWWFDQMWLQKKKNIQDYNETKMAAVLFHRERK